MKNNLQFDSSNRNTLLTPPTIPLLVQRYTENTVLALVLPLPVQLRLYIFFLGVVEVISPLENKEGKNSNTVRIVFPFIT